MFRAIGLLAVAVFGAGCDTPVVDISTLTGTTWQAVTVAGEAPEAGLEPTLRFWSDAVNGNAGCNDYGTSQPPALVNGTLQLGDLERTLRGCAGRAGRIEQDFLDILRAGGRIAFRGGRLVIKSGSAELVLERIQPVIDPIPPPT